jgi:hypothetical protein
VTRLIRTCVQIEIAFRQQVDVVEEVAAVSAEASGFDETDVEQHTAVESARCRLHVHQTSFRQVALKADDGAKYSTTCRKFVVVARGGETGASDRVRSHRVTRTHQRLHIFHRMSTKRRRNDDLIDALLAVNEQVSVHVLIRDVIKTGCRPIVGESVNLEIENEPCG